MNIGLEKGLKLVSSSLLLASVCVLGARAQTAKPAITLDPPTGWELQVHSYDAQGNAQPAAPENFRHLGEATVGELADLHTLTLRFAETTKLTEISVTKDFQIEQGGSCVEGNVYERDTTCRLLVRFTPQGPGNRLGRLTVSSTASATPEAFGLTGFGYSPVISFIPAEITTVPGTYPSSVGLLSGAQNLTVDGGDSLYVADTGNNAIRYLDSSGAFKSLATGLSAPEGIAVDNFGEVFFSEPGANALYEIWEYGLLVRINGSGTGACTAASPCAITSEAVSSPGQMSIDRYNDIFFAEGTHGAGRMVALPYPPSYAQLYDPFTYQETPVGYDAFAVDSGDNLYSNWANGGVCAIVTQSLYNSENSNPVYQKVVGGRLCGFSGDGGLAGNAEIGANLGQIWFDVAGNMYFTDTTNQRVRRVDYNTGIIRTIAGNGTAGYTGDGGPGTTGELANPTGVAVDSQGQVYIISGDAAASSSPQVIRKLNSQGQISFGHQLKSTHSTTHTILVSNTGNSVMTLSNAVISGTNPTDFAIDPNTTSCLLTPASTLPVGASCQIGVIFTPSGYGARYGNLVLLDNTVTTSNTIVLAGAGDLPAATFKITSPANGASFTSGTAVTFTTSVTSASGSAPTGTVQFKVDGANYGSPVTLASGTASTSVTGLTTTTHTLSATYSGDSNYAAGGPISVSITVIAAIAEPPIIPIRPGAPFVPRLNKPSAPFAGRME